MATSTQLLSWDMIAAEVAAGRMMWTGAAQSGTKVPQWSEFYAAVSVTSTGAYGATAVEDYSHLLTYVRVTVPNPTSVTAVMRNSCPVGGPYVHTVTATWGSRPSGYSAYVTLDSGSTYTNVGQVDTWSYTVGPATQTSFGVYFSNGTRSSNTVYSNSVISNTCSGEAV